MGGIFNLAPEYIEFHTFWDNILKRMTDSETTTDFKQPEMTKYMRSFILDISDVYISTPWISGPSAVSLDYTTYASNAIARTHRTMKRLIGADQKPKNVVETIANVYGVMVSKFKSGQYMLQKKEALARIDTLYQWSN